MECFCNRYFSKSFKYRFVKGFVGEKNETFMMKILCPLDFSDHSIIALKYAIVLANKISAEIHILTAFSEPRSSGSFKSFKDKIKENYLREQKHIISSVKDMITTDVAPLMSVVEGTPSRVVKSYADENKIDLIIMATQGSTSLASRIMGSTTKNILESISKPTLVLSSKAQSKGLGNNILLAVDNKKVVSDVPIELLRKISKELNNLIDVIHVASDKNTETHTFNQEMIDKLGDRMGDKILIVEEGVIDSIRKYTSKNDVSILAMIKHKHGFLDRLFFKDHTTVEIDNASVPILIIPE